MNNYNVPKGLITARNWSVELDGKSIIVLLACYPKMTFDEIKTIILGEGGFIDVDGIIHKGSAEDKVVELK